MDNQTRLQIAKLILRNNESFRKIAQSMLSRGETSRAMEMLRKVDEMENIILSRAGW